MNPYVSVIQLQQLSTHSQSVSVMLYPPGLFLSKTFFLF